MVPGHDHTSTVPTRTGPDRWRPDLKRCLYRISVPDDLGNCHVLIGYVWTLDQYVRVHNMLGRGIALTLLLGVVLYSSVSLLLLGGALHR